MEYLKTRVCLKQIEWLMEDGHWEMAKKLAKSRRQDTKRGHKSWLLLTFAYLKIEAFLGSDQDVVWLAKELMDCGAAYSSDANLAAKLGKRAAKFYQAVTETDPQVLKELADSEEEPMTSCIALCRFLTMDPFRAEKDPESLRRLMKVNPVNGYSLYGYMLDGCRLLRQGSFDRGIREMNIAKDTMFSLGIRSCRLPDQQKQEMLRLFRVIQSGYRGKEDSCHLYVKCFGKFGTWVLETGEQVHWRTKKAQLCIAYFVQNMGKKLSREDLIAALWEGEETPENEIAALHNILSSIRKSLSPYGLENLICYQEKHYELAQGLVFSDLPVADRLREMTVFEDGAGLAKHCQILLNYTAERYLDGFDSFWLREVREDYSYKFCEGLYLIGEYFWKKGDAERAEEILWQAVWQAPYLEKAQELLMRICTSQRDKGKLYHFYQRLQQVWQDEMGMEISSHLTEIYQECKEQC